MGNNSFIKKVVLLIVFFSFMFLSTSTILASCCGGVSDGFWFDGCCYGCSTWDSKKMGSACPQDCCTTNATECPIEVPCTGELCDDDDDDEKPKPVCNRCTLGSCPNPPLADTGDDLYKFKDFLSCQDTGTCTDWHYADCYEKPSVQPTASLTIYPNNVKTSYGFVSTTHTGSGVEPDLVNEPIRMVGRYTDSTAGEIEAMYIWFSNTATMPVTPKYIDLNNDSGQAAKTASRLQYGFLMHRDSTGWKPYVPSIVGSSAGDKWVQAAYSGNRFSIKGPDGLPMVNIEILGIRMEGTSVVLDFNVSFRTDNPVQDGMYNIFMMGNDVFGFTPYDNYDEYPEVKSKIGDYWAPELIRFFDTWRDSNKDWWVDRNSPEIVSFDVKVEGRSSLTFTWDVRDNLSLYGIVGNLYVDENFKDLEPEFKTTVSSGGTLDIVSPYIPHEIGSSKVGHLTDDYLFKILGTDGTGSATIYIGDNREGLIYLYITGFDKGGNRTEQDYIPFDLRDWMATQGGLLYSAQGTDVNSRVLSTEALSYWNNQVLSGLGNFIPSKADVSTELVGDLLTTSPLSPLKSNESALYDKVDSYMVRPYDIGNISSYYGILKTSFEKRKSSLPLGYIDSDTTLLTGNLIAKSVTLVKPIIPEPVVPDPIERDPVYRTDPVDPSNPVVMGITNETIRVLDRIGSLTVGTPTIPFNCNGLGLIFVSENLTINGPITNDSVNGDACIFVVKGDVIVQPGAHVSSDTQIRYDQLNAYILTDGEFVIQKENTSYTVTDPLFIGGGIHSLKGVRLERYLKLADRLVFPAFIVNHHSKYGVLAGQIFGTEVNFQKVEVGFKP